MESNLKSNIIIVILVNVICFCFIAFTIFMQFGINIKVVKNVKMYPVEQGTSHYSSYNYRLNQSYDSYIRMVRIESDDDDIESVWVDAQYVFGTDNEKEINELIEDKDAVRLNVFINSKTGETMGVTTKGTSRWSFFYNNNKLLKYGLIILPCVDIFLIGLIVFSEKKLSFNPIFEGFGGRRSS